MRRSARVFSVLLAAGLACGLSLSASAEPTGQPAGQTDPASTTQAPAQAPADAAAAPAANPAAIPVPEGEVVNREEREGGLIVEDIRIGTGYEIPEGGVVVAHYHGTLKDGGTVFDSSFQRGEPIAFPLSGVIQGWQKGVPGMKVGGVRRLTIPAALGYGAAGAGGVIPPNADLVFVIEMVDALQITDTQEGTGETASQNSVAVTNYSVTDASGAKVDGNAEGVPYIWLPGEFQPVQFGLEGMKVGGKRTLKVPAALNQSSPMIQTSRPSNVPITIELELVAVRNLGGMGGAQ